MFLLASIPSPSSGTLDLGPLTIHMYGLMLLAGIAACIALTGRRWAARGGDWDLIFRVAVWGVGFGIVGARLYHVATSWDELPDEWWGPFAVWEGGLGIWGGIAGGVLAGSIIAKRAGASVTALLDAAAPGLLVAQAIGRIGNWWNQELFGKPTDQPWGLEIDVARRPDEYLLDSTFHPTFLYEGLWNLAAAALLLVLDRFYRFKPPALFALYVALYTGFRFFVEQLRIDPSKELAGMRLNAWVSLIVFVAAVAFFIWWQFFRGGRRPRGVRQRRPEPPPAMAVPRGRVRSRR
ncbi:MAG: prolipoprotein diacylglyceryl transferase [Gaiellaceae bacterium MAG52_C11]|nr:prolipoprotein diacylglyceryl transferase [Candidatus Gaiellasilicea maunaloa]